jgi:hypothetical protein
VDIGEVPFRDLHDYVDRTFRHVADNKRLAFEVEVAPNVGRSMHTDAKRLQQILKNLLSNAFKFTERGRVSMDVRPVTEGWSPDNESLNSGQDGHRIQRDRHGDRHSPPRSSRSSSRRSSRRTARRAASTAARAWGSRSARDRRAAGRENPADQHARRGEHVHALPSAQTNAPAKQPRPRRCRRLTCRPPPKRPRPDAERASAPGDASRPAADLAHPTARLPGRAARHAARRPTVPTSPTRPRSARRRDDTNFARMLMEIGTRTGSRSSSRPAAPPRFSGPGAASQRDHARHQPPDIDGWRVLNRLKDDVATRHIPVQLITTEEEVRERGLRMGAVGTLTKPIKTKQTWTTCSRSCARRPSRGRSRSW